MNHKTGLDPLDWNTFRGQAHKMLDAAIDQMEHAADHPWQPAPTDLQDRYKIGARPASTDLLDRIQTDVLPYHGGNIHPRFWGWVQGTGLASDLIAAMAAAATNENMGGRDHGGIYMERAVIDWTRKKMGFPESASGICVTGTSQATVIAFQAARLRVLKNLRATGQGDIRLTAYAPVGVHNATVKALQLLGIGSDNLRQIPLQDGKLNAEILRETLAADRADGALPFLLVGNAGSVDLGLFDDLNQLADLADEHELWLHVDGAFGAWTRLADAPWHGLTDGIERADSIALDFHKWMYVGYDCGMVLIRDEDEHRAAFAARPAYLEGTAQGIAGNEPWFCDYGIDLSRGNRAIKVWCALEMFGEQAFADAITDNCRMAALMAEDVEKRPRMRLGHAVVSNVCTFTANDTLPPAQQSELNAEIALTLQQNGTAVFSTTRVDGIVMLRAAIVNHRTQASDIRAALDAVADLCP
ncbi:pyridoxal phosphate-dependent decarboxylase family protein [Epibacterium ulvae]|uniref:pyridoxal phosphate-dependent decarboxylase family protein n=1 Tax=Epibacterium ulvae TaxID=1156985 RepID=UPI002493064F|nr:pyridoxal-dependent decarboxylase [Epibacterium ulvae]